MNTPISDAFDRLAAIRPRSIAGLPLLWSILLLVQCGLAPCCLAQDADGSGQDAVMAVDAEDIQSIMSDQPDLEAQANKPSGIDLLTLITRGGAFMIPIGLMSLIVVALAVERALSLRLRKIIPRDLADDLRQLTRPIDQFNPAVALRSCDENPSPAARVVTSMLLRTGQPLADVERAATESVQREADRHAAPIRWLTLAAAATPLMGLLGTVWGMIVAFHESTTLTADRSRSEQLSEGIYTALVTTLAGLAVAIPAAILALYLENRLAKLFHRVEELAFEIAPGLTRFAGRRWLDVDGNLRTFDSQKTTGSAAAKGKPPKAGTSPPERSAKTAGDQGIHEARIDGAAAG